MGVLRIFTAIIATIVTLGHGQAQGEKEKEKHDPSKVLYITDQIWVKEVMHGGEQTHMLISFEKLDCNGCRKQSSVMAKLAR